MTHVDRKTFVWNSCPRLLSSFLFVYSGANRVRSTPQLGSGVGGTGFHNMILFVCDSAELVMIHTRVHRFHALCLRWCTLTFKRREGLHSCGSEMEMGTFNPPFFLIFTLGWWHACMHAQCILFYAICSRHLAICKLFYASCFFLIVLCNIYHSVHLVLYIQFFAFSPMLLIPHILF